jgi:hypothetical protein
MSNNSCKMYVGIYGTPGFPGKGDMLTRSAAEHFAEQLKGKIIDNSDCHGSTWNDGEPKKLMIVSAYLEGNERQGQIVAECEAVEEH